jgi:hypothetical protein
VLISATAAHLNDAALLYAPLIAELDQLSPPTRAEALDFLPQAIVLLHHHADRLIADAVRDQRAAAAPQIAGPWA